MNRRTVCLLIATMISGCAGGEATTREQLVSRGEYVVTGVAGCNDCHTPMTPQGPDMRRSLQGAELAFGPKTELPWATIAPKIAGGPASFSHEQFVSFLQTGLRPDGSHPLAPMPPYRLDETDARAVAAYVESIPRAPE